MSLRKLSSLLLLALLSLPVYASGGGEGGEDSITHKMMILVIQVGIILFAARLGGMLAEKLKMPGVLGELGAGIIIGPYALGSVKIGSFFCEGIFPVVANSTFPVSPELYGLCTIASIVLLFLAGVETDLKMFMRYSLAGSLVGIGGVVFSFLAGDLIALYLLPKILPETYPSLSFLDPACLFLGIMSTATSVGITARILSERKRIDSEEGVTIMAGAVIDDVLGIIVLAIGMGILSTSGSNSGAAGLDWAKIGKIAFKAFSVWLGATIIGIVAASKISSLLKLFKTPLPIAIMAFGLALILSGFFETMGLAMIIGAYVMGLALSKTDIRYVIHENLHPLYTFLVPVFFCVMGMMVDVSKFTDEKILIFGLIYTALAIVAKLGGCAIPATICGFNLRGALRIGAGMIPRGEVALIVAGIGLSNGFLKPEIFGIGILMTLITTIAAPPMLIELFKSTKSGLRHPKDDKESSRPFVFELPSVEAAEMMCEKLIKAFRNEGFFTHLLSVENRIWQVRRDQMEIGIHRQNNEIHFECTPSEQNFVATAILEVTAELSSLAKALSKPITTGDVTHLVRDTSTPVDSDNTLDRYITQFIMRPNMIAESKMDIIKKLCKSLVERNLVSDFDTAIKAIENREQVMSTGLENGIAIPHARTNTVKNLVGAIAIVRDGVSDYKTVDGSTVKIVILTLSPEDVSSPHLRLISHISKILNKENRQKLMDVKSEQSMLDIFLGKNV